MKKSILLLNLMALGGVAVAMSGCASMAESSASIASVTSISASSSAVVASIDSPFNDDVRMAAATSAESGASSAEMMRTIGRVAEDHGVTDWEANPYAYYAVGQGLREAGVAEAKVKALMTDLTGKNAEAEQTLLEGYRAP